MIPAGIVVFTAGVAIVANVVRRAVVMSRACRIDTWNSIAE
jgi:hypothetical protein